MNNIVNFAPNLSFNIIIKIDYQTSLSIAILVKIYNSLSK